MGWVVCYVDDVAIAQRLIRCVPWHSEEQTNLHPFFRGTTLNVFMSAKNVAVIQMSSRQTFWPTRSLVMQLISAGPHTRTQAYAPS